MSDLFDAAAARPPNPSPDDSDYSAKDIEVLEGLEPVRRRPGMYIGGTDDHARHHLVAEVLDNAMDEAVAGHAHRIRLVLEEDGAVTIEDDGRGIPVDPHPKFPNKSALEVILTTLHSGGKFGSKAYKTSGGLHGVGVSVVNALTNRLRVEVARDGKLYAQEYSRGLPTTQLGVIGEAGHRQGTRVTFHPDPEIFGPLLFKPGLLYRMARSKAYLHRGVHIEWHCPESLLETEGDKETPAKAVLHFPNGLSDFLSAALDGRPTLAARPFAEQVELADGKVEWALTWPEDGEGFFHSYCNTVPTPLGGSHEAGLRNALTRSMRAYGDLVGNRKISQQMQPEDLLGGAAILLSIFIPEPQFQGQTKEKLVSPEAARLVEQAVKDRFDLWLSSDPATAQGLMERVLENAEERNRRRQQKEMQRKTATRKLRLPGKLADCSRNAAEGTEIFIVEGDSAGGSAKQARNRETQAVLPLRGKILNVARAASGKQQANQELSDLTLALGCGSGKSFDLATLRYERVVIMTDADVDGAHIATLLMTFFYRSMRPLIEHGHLYLALPPLYRLSHGSKSVYARDEADRKKLLKKEFKSNAKVEISRFKGLGEMTPQQLRETTMDPTKRSLLRITLPDRSDATAEQDVRETEGLVEDLMGRKPERRFAYIQDNARFVDGEDLDV